MQDLFIRFEHRPSDSPFIDRVYHCESGHAGKFFSVAQSHFEIVVSRLPGRTFLTLRGPETKATTADCPAGGEWVGIRFKLGAFMPEIPPGGLRDRNDVTLESATQRSFWLDGSALEYPTFENVETFVSRLVRRGTIVRNHVVDAVLHDARSMSLRSAQRHVLRATGMTRSTWRQIERARYATNLLREGAAILDVVHEAGYFDQAHLTRSLKYRIGQTPVEIARGDRQLSFLYKTEPSSRVYDAAYESITKRVRNDGLGRTNPDGHRRIVPPG